MYCITFEYADGRKGTCISDGQVILFDEKHKAEEVARNMNEAVSADVKKYVPVWKAEEYKGDNA